jgi:hypothetical protein
MACVATKTALTTRDTRRGCNHTDNSKSSRVTLDPSAVQARASTSINNSPKTNQVKLYHVSLVFHHYLHLPFTRVLVRFIVSPRKVILVSIRRVGGQLSPLQRPSQPIYPPLLPPASFFVLPTRSRLPEGPSQHGLKGHRTSRFTMSNSSSRSSYSTFSSTSSKPPANAPQRSGAGQCQMRILP